MRFLYLVLFIIIASHAVAFASGSDAILQPQAVPTLVEPEDNAEFHCPKLIRLICTAPKGTNSFHIQLSQDSTFRTLPLLLDDMILSLDTAIDICPTFQKDQKVYWRCQVNGGSWSETRRFMIYIACGLELISPANDTTLCGHATLRWNLPSNTKYMFLNVRTDDGKVIREEEVDGTSMTQVDITAKGDFAWDILVMDSSGLGKLSLTRHFHIIQPEIPTQLAPPQDSAFLVSSTLNKTIRLTWTKSPLAVLYLLDIQFLDSTEHHYLTDTSFVLNASERKNGFYLWKVMALCADSTASTFSTPRSFSITHPEEVSVSDAASSGLILYPNPANDQLTIVLPDELRGLQNDATISIHSLLGETVWSSSMTQVSQAALNINLKALGLSNGLYTLRIQSGSRLMTARFMHAAR